MRRPDPGLAVLDPSSTVSRHGDVSDLSLGTGFFIRPTLTRACRSYYHPLALTNMSDQFLPTLRPTFLPCPTTKDDAVVRRNVETSFDLFTIFNQDYRISYHVR